MKTIYEPGEEDRERMREPRGKVVEGAEALAEHVQEQEHTRVVAVGDRVSIDLATHGVQPDISIVDGKEQREDVAAEEHAVLEHALQLEAKNPAGRITEQAWNRIREAVAHDCPTRLTVKGEEDLLALPIILFAEPSALVVYGQWDRGAVAFHPTEDHKDWVRELMELQRYREVIVGGTWDAFHAGHRYLLLAAFEHGEHVHIGVTSEAFARERADHELDPFEERKEAVETFCERFGVTHRARIMSINDIYGNAVEDGDALLVTRDTLANGKTVNQKRLETGRTPLDLAVMDRITGPDSTVISSSRIRSGLIDRDGLPV